MSHGAPTSPCLSKVGGRGGEVSAQICQKKKGGAVVTESEGAARGSLATRHRDSIVRGSSVGQSGVVRTGLGRFVGRRRGGEVRWTRVFKIFREGVAPIPRVIFLDSR